jgi:hypothetical protein
MTLGAPMVLPALAAENNNLWPACLADNRCADTSAINKRCANRNFVAIAKHDNVIQNNLLAFFGEQTFYQNGVILRNTILFATGLHQSVHGDLPYLNSLVAKDPR